MKIYINARFLSQRITGVQRFAIELSKKIKSINKDIIFIAPKYIIHNKIPKELNVQSCGYLHGHLWEQIELPFYTHDGLLLNLCNTGPIIHHNSITVIHDAAVFAKPEGFSRQFKIAYKQLLPRIGRKSKKIITVSNFSKNELVHFCKIDPSRIEVIAESGAHIKEYDSDKSILKKNNLRNKKYILAVSSLNPNKNFSSVSNALKFVDKDIVKDIDFAIVGGNNHCFSTNTSNSSAKNLGYVTDEELKALYENAFCFIYPSLYEGFGLPPLEAMECGCPVLCSNAASLPEVCSDAAIYFDPYQPKDIAKKIKMLICSPSLRNELIEKGKTRAHQFTWEKSAAQVINIINSLKN
jgi:glycosyltransferase involved in cell wall biosynthesis